ncbi:MAG: hypothetical protein AB8H79_17545, partial [Myxococcota bacterium]
MEGSQWFRLSVIVALFLGSFYVLLPTLFQVDPAQEGIEAISDQAGSLDSFNREYEIAVVEGEPQALAEALEKRLRANNVGIDGVVTKGGKVVVRRSLTTKARDILAQIEPAPGIALHALGLELPPDAPTSAAGLAGLPMISGLAGGPPAQPASDLRVSAVSGPTATLSAPATSAEPLLVVVNDAVRGLIVPATSEDPLVPAEAAGSYAPLGGYSQLAADLAVEPLPGVLSEIVGAVTEDDEDDTDASADERGLPDWLLAILPDTRMPLGLDLQGGIDMTVQ